MVPESVTGEGLGPNISLHSTDVRNMVQLTAYAGSSFESDAWLWLGTSVRMEALGRHGRCHLLWHSMELLVQGSC